jgi:TonB family protein
MGKRFPRWIALTAGGSATVFAVSLAVVILKAGDWVGAPRVWLLLSVYGAPYPPAAVVLGYSIAAIIAVAGWRWLALRIKRPSTISPRVTTAISQRLTVGMAAPEWGLQTGPTRGQRIIRIIGYSLAAIIAIVAGAWFALHLSNGRPIEPVALKSPAVIAPIVALARNMQINVKGLDPTTAPNRDTGSARAVFDTNRDAVLDTYKQALERENTLHDGMVVRLHVLPDGRVGGGSVLVSTSPNPSLDAEVVKTMGDWKFAASSDAPVDVDYPLIFAASSGHIGNLETDLSTRFASLGPNETPEYASAPSVAPTPPVAVRLLLKPRRHRPPWPRYLRKRRR